MWRFWDYVIEPLLTAAGASTVVEIGAASGRNTRRLGRWATAKGAVVHVIDPEPRFDPEALDRAFPDAFVMHRSPSLEVLPRVAQPDAVLIDGDHNWYTVTEELRLLERAGSKWPVTFLHDVGWAYGRRDMYYDPNAFRRNVATPTSARDWCRDARISRRAASVQSSPMPPTRAVHGTEC